MCYLLYGMLLRSFVSGDNEYYLRRGVCVCDWLLVNMQSKMLTSGMLTSVFVKLRALITIMKGSEF